MTERNRAIHWVRARVEKIFGTWKRSCGFRRMRWRGLVNARLQTWLTTTAYNRISTTHRNTARMRCVAAGKLPRTMSSFSTISSNPSIESRIAIEGSAG